MKQSQIENMKKQLSLSKGKKGQMNMTGLILSLVVIGVLVGAFFLIMGEFLTEVQTNGNTDAVDGVNKTIQAGKKIPQFLGIIVLVAVIGIVLYILFAVLPRTGRGDTF